MKPFHQFAPSQTHDECTHFIGDIYLNICLTATNENVSNDWIECEQRLNKLAFHIEI